jgi:hypothetical protein
MYSDATTINADAADLATAIPCFDCRSKIIDGKAPIDASLFVHNRDIDVIANVLNQISKSHVFQSPQKKFILFLLFFTRKYFNVRSDLYASCMR